MPRKFDKDDHQWRRHGGLRRRSDYNGWSNWDTWNVALMIDNDPENQEFFHRNLDRFTPESLRDWAIPNIIAPINSDHLKDAQEWNEIPLEERFGTDSEYEDLRERAEGSPAWSLMGLPPEEHYKDYDPSNHMIDPELVNWQEILDSEREEMAIQDGSYETEEPSDEEPGDTTFPSDWNA